MLIHFRKLNLEKLSFYPDNAFGHHFGSSFQVEKQQLVPVSSAGRWKFGGIKSLRKRERERGQKGKERDNLYSTVWLSQAQVRQCQAVIIVT